MSCAPGAAKPIDGNKDVIIKKPGDEIQTLPSKVHYKNLYVAGKVWVDALKTSLRHTKVRLTPVNQPGKDVPEKPPPMKYQDLPIYDSPHYKYKQYIEDLKKNPNSDKKILHSFLYPMVHKYRRPLTESFSKMTDELKDMSDEAQEAFNKRVTCFKKFMRDPNNVMIGRTVLGLSTVTGVYIGSGTRSVTRKLFGGTLGALSGGALCFPKETDLIFRDSIYIIGTLAKALYKATIGSDIWNFNKLTGSDTISVDSNSEL